MKERGNTGFISKVFVSLTGVNACADGGFVYHS